MLNKRIFKNLILRSSSILGSRLFSDVPSQNQTQFFDLFESKIRSFEHVEFYRDCEKDIQKGGSQNIEEYIRIFDCLMETSEEKERLKISGNLITFLYVYERMNRMNKVESVSARKMIRHYKRLLTDIRVIQPILNPIICSRILRILMQIDDLPVEVVCFYKQYVFENYDIFVPMFLPNVIYGLKRLRSNFNPNTQFSESEIRLFANTVFNEPLKIQFKGKGLGVLIDLISESSIDDPVLLEKCLVEIINWPEYNNLLVVQILSVLANFRIQLSESQLLKVKHLFEQALTQYQSFQSLINLLLSCVIMKEVVYPPEMTEVHRLLNPIVDTLLNKLSEKNVNNFLYRQTIKTTVLLRYYLITFYIPKMSDAWHKSFNDIGSQLIFMSELTERAKEKHIQSNSHLQTLIVNYFALQGITCVKEHFAEFCFVDLYLPDRKTFIEVVGGSHFLQNSKKLNGKMALRLKLLESLGMKVLVVSSLAEVIKEFPPKMHRSVAFKKLASN